MTPEASRRSPYYIYMYTAKVHAKAAAIIKGIPEKMMMQIGLVFLHVASMQEGLHPHF